MSQELTIFAKDGENALDFGRCLASQYLMNTARINALRPGRRRRGLFGAATEKHDGLQLCRYRDDCNWAVKSTLTDYWRFLGLSEGMYRLNDVAWAIEMT